MAIYRHLTFDKGRYYWNKRTEEALTRRLSTLTKPSLAHTGLADSYILQGSYGLLFAKEAYGKAREAGTKALELDDTLARRTMRSRR